MVDAERLLAFIEAFYLVCDAFDSRVVSFHAELPQARRLRVAVGLVSAGPGRIARLALKNDYVLCIVLAVGGQMSVNSSKCEQIGNSLWWNESLVLKLHGLMTQISAEDAGSAPYKPACGPV